MNLGGQVIDFGPLEPVLARYFPSARGAGDGPARIEINLLPPELGGGRRGAKASNAWVVLAMLVVLGGAYVGYGKYFGVRREVREVGVELQTAEEELSRFQQEVALLDSVETMGHKLAARVEAIERLTLSAGTRLRVLQAVSHSLPDDVWLEAVDETKSDSLYVEFTFRGTGRSNDSVIELIKAMRRYPAIQEVGLSGDGLLPVELEGNKVFSFRVNARVLAAAREEEWMPI